MYPLVLPPAGGSVLGQLLEWLRWHFLEGEQLARAAMDHDPPQDHPSYWDAVSSQAASSTRGGADLTAERSSTINPT